MTPSTVDCFSCF